MADDGDYCARYHRGALDHYLPSGDASLNLQLRLRAERAPLRRSVASWHWFDQGLPPGASAVFYPTAITFVDVVGHQQIYVFAVTNQGHLVFNHWDGWSWSWEDHGAPLGVATFGAPSAITYWGPGFQRIQVYVDSEGSGRSGHLFRFFWTGTRLEMD